MHTKDYSLRIKNLDQSGTFSGLGSSYNGVDLVGDTIAPGAFKQAIASQGNGYPLLWAHDPAEPLGLAKVSDSTAGLVVDGTMCMSDPAAVRALAQMRFGSIRGLSIGFTAAPDKITYDVQTNVRTLREIRLFEISLVAIPADPRAQVTAIKSLADADRLFRSFKAGDVGDAEMQSLRSISDTLRGLLTKDGRCLCECPNCPDNCDGCSDDCAECDGDACSGCVAARLAAANMDDLKSFAIELRKLIA